MFSHDTEHALQTIVDLVNTSPAAAGDEVLDDGPAVLDFVTAHRISNVAPSDFQDLRSLHSVRARFGDLFGVDDPSEVAARVNSLLTEAHVRPRLTDHDDYDWHVHYFAPGATLAEHLAVDGGMAVAHLVTTGETDRLRICDAPDCRAVLVDLSRNRSKRYCDARSCGNRLHVAAYRERKRSEQRALQP